MILFKPFEKKAISFFLSIFLMLFSPFYNVLASGKPKNLVSSELNVLPTKSELEVIKKTFKDEGGEDSDYGVTDRTPITSITKRENPENHRTLIVKNIPSIMQFEPSLEKESFRNETNKEELDIRKIEQQFMRGDFIHVLMNIMADSREAGYICCKRMQDRAVGIIHDEKEFEKYLDDAYNFIKGSDDSRYNHILTEVSNQLCVSKESAEKAAEAIIKFGTISAINTVSPSVIKSLTMPIAFILSGAGGLVIAIAISSTIVCLPLSVAWGFVVGGVALKAMRIADKKIDQIKDFNRTYINAEINRNCVDVLNNIFNMFLDGDENDLKIANALIMDIDLRERALEECDKIGSIFTCKEVYKKYPNQGAYCWFKCIKDLENAPSFGDYCRKGLKNEKGLKFYIDAARCIKKGSNSEFKAFYKQITGKPSPEKIFKVIDYDEDDNQIKED